MVTAVGVLALTANVALVAPAGTFTLAGTTAAPAGSAANDTAAPFAGAAIFSVTVPCKVRPSVTLAELRLMEDSSKGAFCAETEPATPRQRSKVRRIVPSTRIMLIDLVASGPL